MDYKSFQDISLSRLGMGNMRLPVQGDKAGAPIDRVRAQEIIDYAMENGINYFDSAYVYHGGESEKFLGEAMKKYPRDTYYLATKFLLSTNPDYKAVFEEQLERLQTDRIDFYLLHAIFDGNCRSYLDSGCIKYFLEQKKAGRIRYLGFSSHAGVEALTKMADHHQWDFAQIQLNYFDWLYGDTAKEYKVLEERNIPIMVMEPVRGGRLAVLSGEAEKMLKAAHPDWSMASWALRWVKRLPQVQVILSGMSDMEQIRDNVRTFQEPEGLTDEDAQLLMRACEAFKKQVSVPCTACRYCCDGCPMKIDIPAYLDVYNSYRTDGPWALNRMGSIESAGKPSDCIGCGACAGHCPQSIQIPEIMSELAELSKKNN
ncbi:MAG: 4Fe-4S dicluster domain-containing protein [Butyrivibrio sp.]|nr:4Fe-4S dicluster domain-containing protein [Butyrivibrio sp.]